MIKKKPYMTAEKYIELISQDFQFNPKDDRYMGFINIDPRSASELGEDHSDPAMRIAMNPINFEAMANKYGLTIESAHESELIFGELLPIQKTKPVF